MKKSEYSKRRPFELKINGVINSPVSNSSDALHISKPWPQMAEAILDSLPVGVTVQNHQGDLVLENPAADTLRHSRSNAQRTSSLGKSHAIVGSLPDSYEYDILVENETYGVEITLDLARQYERESLLLNLAQVDELTGLANRTRIREIIDNLIESDAGSFAIAFIDIDNFKRINDWYGHAIGDMLLCKIAERLSQGVRSADVVSRIGGDEFMVLFNPIDTPEALDDLADRLSERLRDPFYIDGTEVFTSASTGISIFPVHGRSYDVLRANADTAMYQIKKEAKGGVAYFDKSMTHFCAERMQIEQKLRTALHDGLICCAFQPKVNIRTGTIEGVEALLRLRDDKGNVDTAGDFVATAVEIGLMNEISTLVLEETLESLELIQTTFGESISISLNVAAEQASDANFMKSFITSLKETGCPERFVIEITEEAFLAANRFQTEVLPIIRSVGARVSIDDFGVGYSSLATLADITADEIKIDRSFISKIHERPRSQSILKAIESLASALGMSIVAEGVETHEELEYIEEMTDISCVQGFYFARPVLLNDGEDRRIEKYFSRKIAANRSSVLRAPVRARS